MKKRAISLMALTAMILLLTTGCDDDIFDSLKPVKPSSTVTTTTTGTTTVTSASDLSTTDTSATAPDTTSAALTTTTGTIATTKTTKTTKTTASTTKTTKSTKLTTYPPSGILDLTDIPANATELNVCEYGADNTGKKDSTLILTCLHNTGKRIYYPNGTYLFNGATLNFSGGVRFESKNNVIIRNSISDVAIVNFDSKGNLIGLMQNHLEEEYNKKKPNEYSYSGSLVSPPLYSGKVSTKVDFLPYWYNDFGLESTRAAGGAYGWLGWYDWRWNHHGCEALGENYDPYDPTRHPLLGWYRGDDPVVLDWQCYWMRVYGINQVCLLCADLTGGEAATSRNHWAYELMNNTPNAKKMNFCAQVDYFGYQTTSLAAAKASWQKTLDTIYFKYDNIYCVTKNGKKYPAIFIWDEQSIRYGMDMNSPSSFPNMRALYTWMADAFRSKGYDGVCIMARNPYLSGFSSIIANLASKGVLWCSVAYPTNCLGNGSDYKTRVDNFVTLTDVNAVYGVTTGMDTHTPHPSNWSCPGNTPTLFGELISRAVATTLANSNRLKLITCYNVAEWAEGGPGLQPTVGDGFKYLEAIYKEIKK